MISDSAMSIGDETFSGCSNMTIYYSGNALDSYIDGNSSDWSAQNIVWVKL